MPRRTQPHRHGDLLPLPLTFDEQNPAGECHRIDDISEKRPGHIVIQSKRTGVLYSVTPGTQALLTLKRVLGGPSGWDQIHTWRSL